MTMTLGTQLALILMAVFWFQLDSPEHQLLMARTLILSGFVIALFGAGCDHIRTQKAHAAAFKANRRYVEERILWTNRDYWPATFKLMSAGITTKITGWALFAYS